MNYVGFWKNNQATCENKMPWDKTPVWTNIPIANSATENQDHLIELLLEKQKHASIQQYLGYSNCRICNAPNGSSEYSADGFVWPSGYVHYLKDHNVE